MEAVEVRLQKAIEDFLCKLGVYPWLTLYCSKPLFLKLSFLLETQRKEFLKFLDYKNLADKSGILICEDKRTVVIRGITLRYFLEKLERDEEVSERGS